MRDYHVDAVERYNVTCDFPAVIRELKDPHKRFPFQVQYRLSVSYKALLAGCIKLAKEVLLFLVLMQDITVGKPAKTQLARAVRGPEEAYNIMKGRPFVVETKFDGASLSLIARNIKGILSDGSGTLFFVGAGERMQVHVLKDEIRYYSRRGIEHGSYSSYTVLDKFIRKQLRETDLILDGEVVVWNKAK